MDQDIVNQSEETNNLEFYKELYSHEFERKSEIDSSINFPTTLISLLIAAAFYFFNMEGFKYHKDDNWTILIILIIIATTFSATILIAILLLIKMYLNTFRKYEYLPSPVTLKEREVQLYNHYFNFYKNSEEKKPKKKANQRALHQFELDLLNYYIKFSTNNQTVNDNRMKDYYLSRKFLMFAVVLLACMGLLIKIK